MHKITALKCQSDLIKYALTRLEFNFFFHIYSFLYLCPERLISVIEMLRRNLKVKHQVSSEMQSAFNYLVCKQSSSIVIVNMFIGFKWNSVSNYRIFY